MEIPIFGTGTCEFCGYGRLSYACTLFSCYHLVGNMAVKIVTQPDVVLMSERYATEKKPRCNTVVGSNSRQWKGSMEPLLPWPSLGRCAAPHWHFWALCSRARGPMDSAWTLVAPTVAHLEPRLLRLSQVQLQQATGLLPGQAYCRQRQVPVRGPRLLVMAVAAAPCFCPYFSSFLPGLSHHALLGTCLGVVQGTWE